MSGEVKLREVEASDLPVLFEQQREPEAVEMAAFPARDKERFLAHWARILSDETVISRAILYQGELAGTVVSFEQDGKCQVGYWIGKAFWGKGIVTIALLQFLRSVESRPLYAHVAKHNVGSIRVLEKSGFKLHAEDRAKAGPDGPEAEEYIFILEE